MCKLRCMYLAAFRDTYKCIELENDRKCPYQNYNCEFKTKNSTSS